MTHPSQSAPVATVLPDIDTGVVGGLLGATRWGGEERGPVTVSYSFAGPGATWYEGGDGKYSFYDEPSFVTSALPEDAKAAFRLALTAWSDVSGLSWQEVTESATEVGDVRIAFTSVPAIASWWGWTYAPEADLPSGGDLWINPAAPSGDWSAGGADFFAAIHEAGHALGLKHLFDGVITLTGEQDSRLYSVMSYIRHPHSYLGTNGSGKDVYVEPSTPMLLDIAAAQYLYGVNTNHATGNDLYRFDAQTPFIATLWDAGGQDTLSAGDFDAGCVIDLRPGTFSSFRLAAPLAGPGPGGILGYDGSLNLGIAFGTVIEAAVGGRGDDHLIGNGVGNLLLGGRGDDTLEGAGGFDRASYAGAGSAVTVSLELVSGQDTGGAGVDLLSEIEGLLGSSHDDTLTGNADANWLDGRGGADTLAGGLGDDTYVVDHLLDVVVEAAGAGKDTVVSRLGSFELGANVERLRIVGSGFAEGVGNGLDNLIYSSAGDNLLDGGAGMDTVSYALSGSGVVIDLAVSMQLYAPGTGTDQLAGFEHLQGSRHADTLAGDAGPNRLTGLDGDDSMLGQGGPDTLAGGAGDDTLAGGEGADMLIGGTGVDRLAGGAGRDLFRFVAAGEVGVAPGTRDRIIDFEVGLDRIDLRAFDADAELALRQSFATLLAPGNAFSSSGQLMFSDGVLYGNVDSDTDAELALELVGVAALDLSALLL